MEKTSEQIESQLSSEEEAKLREQLVTLNELFDKMGLPKLDVVRPDDCMAQEVNARFMDQQMLARLVENIKMDGRLESTPLVCPSSTPGKYWTISGHHRIEGAIKANVRWILVMVINVADMDQLRAKQLSHNAIEGEDDDIVLQKMYEALKSIQAKLYSGLQDRLQPVSVVSLSFRAGSFQSFTVAFLPGDIADYDAALELVKNLPVTASSVVRVGELDSYEMFSKAIRQVKQVDNVKASGTALSVLIQRGLERLAQVKEEQKAAESKDPVVEEIGVE